MGEEHFDLLAPRPGDLLVDLRGDAFPREVADVFMLFTGDVPRISVRAAPRF
jgi:hypothetical protein